MKILGLLAMVFGVVSHPLAAHFYPIAWFAPFLIFGVGVAFTVYNPRVVRERKREQHLKTMQMMVNPENRVREERPRFITILEGHFPKNCEFKDGVWKEKPPEAYDAVFKDGEVVVDWTKKIEAEEKPSAVQVWQDFRYEIRTMIVDEIQNIMSEGWPFDAQLSKLSPHDLQLSRRALAAQIESGLSKAELGRRLGVSSTTVSEWLHARRKIPAKHVGGIKRHLKLESGEAHK